MRCSADGSSATSPLTNQSPKAGPKIPAYILPTTDDGQSSSTPATAEQIALRAAELVGGDRQKTHGDKVENHQNIADLWNAYLGGRINPPLSPRDVALLMALLKIARTKIGDHNLDDYTDLAGYAAVAGEIAERTRT